ncbi:hypothetical protein GCM10023195_86070 [Actinoallomurus liliacearum]|uniref:Uncharacterized protein n=1 Tax=Actinoallomurus liliacearum TaxID=1080073 RepID=A0ABP8U2S2_9ACTN
MDHKGGSAAAEKGHRQETRRLDHRPPHSWQRRYRSAGRGHISIPERLSRRCHTDVGHDRRPAAREPGEAEWTTVPHHITVAFGGLTPTGTVDLGTPRDGA